MHLSSVVIWLCKRFNRDQIKKIVSGLEEVLKKETLEIQPRDEFKEQHPNYRNYYVDPEPPLKAPSKKSKKKKWKKILKEHQKKTQNP